MAIRPVTVVVEGNQIVATWTGLADTDQGVGVEFGKYDKVSVHRQSDAS